MGHFIKHFNHNTARTLNRGHESLKKSYTFLFLFDFWIIRSSQMGGNKLKS
jgi:hypothetical protein